MKPANPSKVIIVPRPPVSNGGQEAAEAAESAPVIENAEVQPNETSVGEGGECCETASPQSQAAPAAPEKQSVL